MPTKILIQIILYITAFVALIGGIVTLLIYTPKQYTTIYTHFQTENTQYLQRDACVRELLKTVQARSAIAVKGHTCWEIKHQPESLHDWEGK